jgi:hydrocephalus-inducing protein
VKHRHKFCLLQVANTLDLGQVLMNDKCVRAFSVLNRGLIPIDFEWNVGNDARLSVTPNKGRVDSGRQAVQLCYIPTGNHKLGGRTIKCRIVNGSTYTIQLTGCGHKPKLSLSFKLHDFGRVYEHGPGAMPYQKELTLRNEDQQARVL